MKKVFVICICSALFLSCSNGNESSFNLVCNVDTQLLKFYSGIKNERNTKETLSLNFKNKKLESYECPIWEEHRISCGKDVHNDVVAVTERYLLDRKSGQLTYTKISVGKYIDEQISSKGLCEKVNRNKF